MFTLSQQASNRTPNGKDWSIYYLYDLKPTVSHTKENRFGSAGSSRIYSIHQSYSSRNNKHSWSLCILISYLAAGVSRCSRVALRRAHSTTVPLHQGVPASLWKLGRLNHIAIAVPDMEKATALYRDVLGATVSEKVPLPDHGVYTVFVELGNTKLELLHPLGEKSPISGFLLKNKSGGMHHICIEVRRRWQGRAFITFLHGSASFICSRDPKFTRLNSEFVHFRTSSCLRLRWRVYNEWVYWFKALVALVFYETILAFWFIFIFLLLWGCAAAKSFSHVLWGLWVRMAQRKHAFLQTVTWYL